MDDVSHNRRSDDVLLTIFTLVAEGVKDALNDDEAVVLGQHVVDVVCQIFSGEIIYIGKNRTANSIIMSQKIWADFSGNNHLELSKKYNCTIQWIYRVIKQQSQITQAEVQLDIFEEHGL